ncbi:DUF1627 domain-containing protein [Salmonella enterica subsp. enterica]|nr:DUF1627 domain-containing protein [Salmonella enterica subsp. enterica]EDY2803910.1 DUF1627 domain-containing protein [Salmonella enterica subsp. enterica]
MESVLDALKAMGKATAREIAARLDIDVRDALEMLSEQQELGAVEFQNGYWSLSGTRPVTTKTVKRKAPKPKNQEDTVVKIGELQLMDVIRAHGPQTAEDLATLFGITSRKVIATLATATAKGRLSRVKQDGNFRYCLPEQVLPEPDVEPVAEFESETVQDATSAIDDSAESDTVRATDNVAVIRTESNLDGLTLPTPKEISRVIRKLRNALRQAEQVRKIAIAAKKHEKSMSRLTRSLQELQQ